MVSISHTIPWASPATSAGAMCSNGSDARKKAQPRELAYFCFYIVAEKKHEREIETLLIRVGGAHLHFNERKKRIDIEAGNVNDYEAGTSYVERQRKRGRTKAVKRGRKRKTG